MIYKTRPGQLINNGVTSCYTRIVLLQLSLVSFLYSDYGARTRALTIPRTC